MTCTQTNSFVTEVSKSKEKAPIPLGPLEEQLENLTQQFIGGSFALFQGQCQNL